MEKNKKEKEPEDKKATFENFQEQTKKYLQDLKKVDANIKSVRRSIIERKGARKTTKMQRATIPSLLSYRDQLFKIVQFRRRLEKFYGAHGPAA